MRPAKTAANCTGVRRVMIRLLWKQFILFGALLILSGCADQRSTTPEFIETGNPTLLSDWNVLHISNDTLVLNERVIPYDLNTPLFTDYARKFRTIWMPEGVRAKYHETATFNFPVGTIISKTFYYPSEAGSKVYRTDAMHQENQPEALDLKKVKLIETRILARRTEGWVALPYVWNEDETEAVLKRTGDIKRLELIDASGKAEPFPYVVPNTNQCAGCHATNATTRTIEPIGPKARHLNKDYIHNNMQVNQLDKLAEAGFLSDVPGTRPKLSNWMDSSVSVDERARAYLDINCAHCHNKVGPADTSGLHFEPETAFGAHLGICKTSIAAGAGTGGRAFDIIPGNPDASILTYRLDSDDPAIMMPELGRSTIHHEGVELLKKWISEMPGNCD